MNAFPIDLLALSWGLAGGFSHCIGMCGVFVVAVSGLPEPNAPRAQLWQRQGLFHGGRLLSLTVLGALAGTLGTLTHAWASAQSVGSIAVGVVMVALALGFAGVVPQFTLPEPDVLGAGGGAGRRAFRRVLQSRSVFKPLLVGLFVGLLPCGLTYQALIAALTLGTARGALLMALFGIGTVPGLLALGAVTQAGSVLMNRRFRQRMTWVSAALMCALGIAFVWRGLMAW